MRVVESVTSHAGARPNDRDGVDRRIIREFQERKSRIIHSQNDVGGYANNRMNTRKLKVPGRNVDEWLAEFARKLE